MNRHGIVCCTAPTKYFQATIELSINREPPARLAYALNARWWGTPPATVTPVFSPLAPITVQKVLNKKNWLCHPLLLFMVASMVLLLC